MTLLFSVLCFVVAFSPFSAVFLMIVARDALRVILFFLGSFFWLIAILFSGIVALLLPSVVPVLFISALFQEVARVGYFLLLHRAQRDLEKVAASGAKISSLKTSFASRHVLAVVCGLGFGVSAALFLLVNVLADYSGHGVVGLPASVPKIAGNMAVVLTTEDAAFPLIYSLSNALLAMNHVVWTVVLWDACHNYANNLQRQWYVGASLPIILHILNSFVSLLLRQHTIPVLLAQAVIFLAGTGHAYLVVKKPKYLANLGNFMGVVMTNARGEHTE